MCDFGCAMLDVPIADLRLQMADFNLTVVVYGAFS